MRKACSCFVLDVFGISRQSRSANAAKKQRRMFCSFFVRLCRRRAQIARRCLAEKCSAPPPFAKMGEEDQRGSSSNPFLHKYIRSVTPLALFSICGIIVEREIFKLNKKTNMKKTRLHYLIAILILVILGSAGYTVFVNSAKANEEAASLASVLPGDDANIILHYKSLQEANAIVDNLIKSVDRKKVLWRELNQETDSEVDPSQFFSGIQEIFLVAKVEDVNLIFGDDVDNPLAEIPVVAAMQVNDYDDQILQEIIQSNEDAINESEDFTLNQMENGIYVIENNKNPLSGKLADNPLLAEIEADPSSIAVAVDGQSLTDSIEIPEDEDSQNTELLQGVKDNLTNIILSLKLKKNKSTSTSSIRIKGNFSNEETPQMIVDLLKPELKAAIKSLPFAVRKYVKFTVAQEATAVLLDFSITNLKSFATAVQKLAR